MGEQYPSLVAQTMAVSTNTKQALAEKQEVLFPHAELERLDEMINRFGGFYFYGFCSLY